MAERKSRNFTLRYCYTDKLWKLERDSTKTVVITFKRKSRATQTGVLENAIGIGTVTILHKNGTYEEFRSYRRVRYSLLLAKR